MEVEQGGGSVEGFDVVAGEPEVVVSRQYRRPKEDEGATTDEQRAQPALLQRAKELNFIEGRQLHASPIIPAGSAGLSGVTAWVRAAQPCDVARRRGHEEPGRATAVSGSASARTYPMARRLLSAARNQVVDCARSLEFPCNELGDGVRQLLDDEILQPFDPILSMGVQDDTLLRGQEQFGDVDAKGSGPSLRQDT